MSRTQIKDLLQKARQSPQSDELARLERERDKHLMAIKKLDRQIAQLNGGKSSDAAPARRETKPGRKKGFKLSASTRAKMRAAALRRHAKAKPERRRCQSRKPESTA